MKLIIVESPAKCKKIESFLGKDYTCLASYGHITCLPNLKCINFENYKLDFEIAKEKVKYITKLKSALKKSDEVIAAAFAGHAASNRDFIELSAELDFAIGKSQRDLACGQCFALIGAFEDDVLHGGTAQRFSALLT